MKVTASLTFLKVKCPFSVRAVSIKVACESLKKKIKVGAAIDLNSLYLNKITMLR